MDIIITFLLIIINIFFDLNFTKKKKALLYILYMVINFKKQTRYRGFYESYKERW